jgi:hypothetical protein
MKGATMKAECKIDVRVLKGLAYLAGREKSRYVLQSVCAEFEPDSLTFVATDGHRLGAAHFDRAEADFQGEGSYILGLDIVDELKVEQGAVQLQFPGNGSVQVLWKDRVLECKLIESRFPVWRTVVPQSAFGPTYIASFNPDLLAGFGKCVSTIWPGQPPYLKIRSHTDPMGAFSILCEKLNFYGALMSCRVGGFEIPDWAKPIPKPTPNDTPNAA